MFVPGMAAISQFLHPLAKSVLPRPASLCPLIFEKRTKALNHIVDLSHADQLARLFQTEVGAENIWELFQFRCGSAPMDQKFLVVGLFVSQLFKQIPLMNGR